MRRAHFGMLRHVFLRIGAVAAVALARPLEDWWICDHATSGGLDWPKLKLQMQSIAGWDPGVYGLKTQAHTELMMVLYARVDRWHRKDSDCPLGELSFRWLLLASQEQKNLLGSFKRVNSGKIENWLDSLLDAAWSDVWKLAAQWHEVLASGWPIFALMGLCSKKLRSLSLGDSEVSEMCRGGEQLQRFTLALEEDGMLPAAALEKALESAAVQACAYARATVYVFAADMVRRGREEGLLLDLESGTEMLSKAQVAAHSSRALVEVINPWPLWKALDRFSCAGLVNVSVQQVPNFLPVRNWFWIFVSPTRANHQDQVISNSVRAKQQPYCSREFRNSLAQVASQAPSDWQPRIVEVGAHFGDCMLWAAAAIPGVRCLGIEADLGRWQRFQRSVVANNFQDNIQAIRALAGSSEYKDHTEFEGSQLLSFVPGLALDDVWSEPLDVLKIHINGGEHLVLKGARRIFELGVKAVVVSCKNHTEMFRVVHFLLKYDYDMQISGEAVNATLRGNSLLRHIEEIIQETGRKHLQAMQRKTVTDCFKPQTPSSDVNDGLPCTIKFAEMVAVTLRALPLLPYVIDATQAKLSPKGDSSFYTTNPICNKKNCVNPFSPGLMDLPRLENLIWQCSPSGEVQKYVSFCKDAIDYDAAVPTNNVTAPINKIVLSQDSAASTMFFYHLNGLGYDAWEFKKPEEFEDPCVKSVYKLSCMTYFPKNQAGCKTGSQIPFMRPCRNACGSYLDQCKVECCDASTQCVFEEDTASGIKQSGYFDQDGPSAFCTGGATRMSPSATLLLHGLLFLLGWHALPERRFLFGSKHMMAVALLFCACNLQGCSLFIPSHRVPNWRKEADYLVQYEFVPEGQPESAATLNSCRSAVPGDKVCSGRGQCKPWSHAPLKVDAWPATYTAFCECDYHWADPECGTRRKSQIKAFLISLFFGIFGLDRFYLGFFYTGLAKLVTLGGLGFWWIYDLVRIGAAPTYALNYKVAADLPHWLFMSIVVLLFTALGLLWSLDSYGRLRKKRRSEAMQFMAEGNEPLKKDDEPLNAWGGKWHGGYGSLPDYPSAHAPYVTRSA